MVFVFQHKVVTEYELERIAKEKIADVKRAHPDSLAVQIREIEKLKEEASRNQQGRQYFTYDGELKRLKKGLRPSETQQTIQKWGEKASQSQDTKTSANETVKKLREDEKNGTLSLQKLVGELKSLEQKAADSDRWSAYWVYFSARIYDEARLNVQKIRTHQKSSQKGEMLTFCSDAELKALRSKEETEKKAWLAVAAIYKSESSKETSSSEQKKQPSKPAGPQAPSASSEKKKEGRQEKTSSSAKGTKKKEKTSFEKIAGYDFDSLLATSEISSGYAFIGISKETAREWLIKNWQRISKNAAGLIADQSSGGHSADVTLKDEHGTKHDVSLASVSQYASTLELIQSCMLVELYREFLKSANPHVSIRSNFYHAILRIESGYNRNAVNPRSGALGIGQLMPRSIISFDDHERFFLKNFDNSLVDKWSLANGRDFVSKPESKNYRWKPEAKNELAKLHKGIFYSMLHAYSAYLKLENEHVKPTEYHIAEKYNAGSVTLNQTGSGDSYAAEVMELVRRQAPATPLATYAGSAKKR